MSFNFEVNTAGDWHNRYCGPAAVSLLTGAPTCEVAKVVKDRFRDWDSRVRTMYDHELIYALNFYGRKTVRQSIIWGRGGRPKTLGEFTDRLLTKPGVAYIIAAGHHYQTYWNGMIKDNWGSWPVEEFPYKKRKYHRTVAVNMREWTRKTQWNRGEWS